MSPIPAADYSFFGKIKVSGRDRTAVLHNVLTQDIKSLPVGQHRPAALLTHTGKILLYMEVFCFDNCFVLVLENTPADKGIPLLEKFIITEDAELKNVTSDYDYFQALSQPYEKFLVSKENCEGFLAAKSLSLVTGDELTRLRVEAGIPLYNVDMSEETILSETGLEKIAVSSGKGCYPGQEVIARIETYKGLNRRLMRLKIPGPAPKALDPLLIRGGKKAGWITSFTKSSEGWTVLAYVEKSAWGEFKDPHLG